MKLRLLLLFAVFSTVINAHAGINKTYVQHIGTGGSTYHVFSKKMPSVDKKSSAKSISFDYTYSESTDSVIMLMSIEIPYVSDFESASLTYCEESYSSNIEKIYIDANGNGFFYRIGITIPYKIWEALYNCATPFTLSIGLSNRQSNDSLNFGYSGKKWEKHRTDLNKILEIIRFNRKND